MANSPVIGGSHSSSGSHIMDDVYITGSLSQIPVSPTTSPHDWALDREDSQSPLPLDHMRIRSNTSPSNYTHIVRTLSPHPPIVTLTHRRSSPDPYHDTESSDTAVDKANTLHALDSSKSSSYTLLDHKPHDNRPCSAVGRKTLLQNRAASSPSLDHVGDRNEVLPQQPQSTSSSSYNYDVNARTAAAGSSRRGSKLSLEDLTRIEPCRDVKKKTSHEEQNGDLLDVHVQKHQVLSPIEDSHSSLTHSQELSLSGNAPSEFNYHRSNKKSYSSQRERLRRSLSKPLAGTTSQSASSEGSYSFDYSLSSDQISGKSPSVTTDTSQVECDSSTGSQHGFTRTRANSFKKFLESSLHEAFPSLDDDEEEATALEVKSVQHSQDEYGKGANAKLSPLNDHVVNHLSSRDMSKGYSPGASPKKPHRIVMQDDSASQPFHTEQNRSHTIERVFSDGNFQDHRKKHSGSIFANKHVS